MRCIVGCVRKISHSLVFFFFIPLYFVLHFIRISFFVLIVLRFVFAYNTTQMSMPSAGYEPATPASDRWQTLALDRSAIGISRLDPGPSSP
jgi:hypothetical protein